MDPFLSWILVWAPQPSCSLSLSSSSCTSSKSTSKLFGTTSVFSPACLPDSAPVYPKLFKTPVGDPPTDFDPLTLRLSQDQTVTPGTRERELLVNFSYWPEANFLICLPSSHYTRLQVYSSMRVLVE